METDFERKQLKLVYPSKAWAWRIDSMPDPQVLAIYFRLKSVGKVV